MSLPEGEATDIIRKTNSGITVECENANEIARAIMKLSYDQEIYKKFRISSINAATYYSRDSMAKKMIEVIEKYEK